MDVSSRERQVMNFLLKLENPIAVREIAEALNVSERTVHRDLKGIERILSDFGLELIKKSGIGLLISGREERKKALLIELQTVSPYSFSAEERQVIILSSLLEMNEPIKLFTLANELKTTIAAITQDLDQLKKDIQSFDLRLIRKRGYGVQIEGDESGKRAVLSKLISSYMDVFELIYQVKENIQKQTKLSMISDKLLGHVSSDKLLTVKETVDWSNEELKFKLTDNAYVGLVVHLALAVERIQKGEGVDIDPAYLKEISSTKEFNIAKKMTRRLEQSLSLRIPENETVYITMHLLGAKLSANNAIENDGADLDIAFKIRKLIDAVETKLVTKLSNHDPLQRDLLIHLKPAVFRLKKRMNINNPLLNEIQKDYEELFEVVDEAVSEVFPELVFPKDEIGFIVLHFAAALLNAESFHLRTLVLCSSGIGTSKILATSLQKQFPEIKEIKNISILDLNHIDTSQFDLIVSTVQLHKADYDYVLASPMLTEDEVDGIRKAIRARKLSHRHYAEAEKAEVPIENEDYLKKLANTKKYLDIVVNLLDAFHINEMEDSLSISLVLLTACHVLEKEKRIVNRDIVHAKLIERAQLGGVGIPETKLALYHTRDNHILSPTFTIYRLRKPIQITGMDGNRMDMNTILLMLSPQSVNSEVIEIMSSISGLLIQEPKAIELLEEADEDAIKRFLSEHFFNYIQQKQVRSLNNV